MNTIKVLDLTMPAPMEETIKDLLGSINRFSMRQTTAADSAGILFFRDTSPVVVDAGRIRRLTICLDVGCGNGEDYSIELEKSTDGGVTWVAITGDPIEIDNDSGFFAGSVVHTFVGTQLTEFVDIENLDVGSGDQFRAVIDYTAGATPTPAVGLSMWLDIAPLK